MLLSAFPDLLFLSPFAAFVIRVALGVVFGYVALRHFENTSNKLRALAALEAVLAVSLIAGAWTQVAAIASLLVIGLWYWSPSLRTVALGTAILSAVLAFTLIITGAGPFAIDLPL